MNSNDIYSSYTKQLNINFENIKDKIKDNEIQKLISMISELRDLRNEYITDFSKDTSIRNRYRGQILSSSRGSCMTIDLDKSIEYEAILTASLQLIIKDIDINVLKDKNDEINKCTICLDNTISHCCVPCGHTYCSDCINKTDNCYICRGFILNKTKIYL